MTNHKLLPAFEDIFAAMYKKTFPMKVNNDEQCFNTTILEEMKKV